jgi:hypothetical protein
MNVILPLSMEGCSVFTFDFNTKTYTFRFYYIIGQYAHWLLDIFDADGTCIVASVNVTAGSKNCLAGFTHEFDPYWLQISQDNANSDHSMLAPNNELFAYFIDEDTSNQDLVMMDRLSDNFGTQFTDHDLFIMPLIGDGSSELTYEQTRHYVVLDEGLISNSNVHTGNEGLVRTPYTQSLDEGLITVGMFGG